MGLRTSIGNRLVSVGKAFGGQVPPAILAAERAQQMTPESPFSPGEPVSPFDGYSRQPRTRDFQPGYNIATRPRLHERTSFDTLTGLIDAYDVAQIAIWHRIDTLRAVKYRLVAADWYTGDVEDAVKLAQLVLRKPDRRHNFKNWLGRWLYDALAYDAAPLYRLRNRGGKCIGLLPVSGPTIAPLLDYWGNEPDPPAESHVQYAQGLPWNWLTRDDLIYEPMRAVNSSVYGRAPIESIILNANTDIRFQLFFLQRFTEGNIPEAFAAAPETWSPEQIEQFQAYWDSFMYGDQAAKHQIKWMPGGSTISWTNEKDFSDSFSLHMMRKTCACFHVVPTDLGFTDSANYSTGESQADVAHKVGELPLMEWVEEILSQFLVDDLGLPLRFEFDKGEDQDDRLVQAQADDYYIKNATVSSDEIREMRFGLPTDQERPVPRIFFSSRGGPIPLNALYGVAGSTDPETGGPAAGAPLPEMVFPGTPGVLDAQVHADPLAVDEYGPKALPAAPPPQPPDPDAPVAKDAAPPAGQGGSGPAEGITADTGIYSDPLMRSYEDDEDEEEVAKELAAFRRFTRARRRQGAWRDFTFEYLRPREARELNRSGHVAVAKALDEIAVAGLAVQALDTGRVLMLQRSLDHNDPAAGKLEFPGGHLENDESPLAAAWREWAEETGCAPPPGTEAGRWTANGVYQGIVWQCETESMVPVRCDTQIANPDDSDGDGAEAIMWTDPRDLPGNPMLRDELAASLDDVLPLLLPGDDSEPDDVAKAANPPPKRQWPGWTLDLPAADHWGPKAAQALALLDQRTATELAQAYRADNPPEQQPQDQNKRDAVAAAAAWLALHGPDLAAALAPLLPAMAVDGFLIGAASEVAVLSGRDADTAGWKPGGTGAATARAEDIGLGDALRAARDRASETADAIAHGWHVALGRVLVEGVQAGRTAAAIGRDLIGALADVKHATAAALDFLLDNIGHAAKTVIEQWPTLPANPEAPQESQDEWIIGDKGPQPPQVSPPPLAMQWVTTAGACPACLDNEAAGPIPAGEVWPDGSDSPPGHPHCRCYIVGIPLGSDAAGYRQRGT